MTVLPETGSDGLARAAALQRLQLASVAPASIVEFESRGRCLVIGEEADALAFVRTLAGQLECFVLVPGDLAPDVDRSEGTFVVHGGRPLVRGALGDFEVALVVAGATQELGGLLMPEALHAAPIVNHRAVGISRDKSGQQGRERPR